MFVFMGAISEERNKRFDRTDKKGKLKFIKNMSDEGRPRHRKGAERKQSVKVTSFFRGN